jgi:hypothetical protein
MPKKVKKVMIIANNGPEDPNRATVPFLTAKALADRGSMYPYGFTTMRLSDEGRTAENIKPPVFRRWKIFCFTDDDSSIPIYIGVSCAMGRGFCDERQKPTVEFSAGELQTLRNWQH